MSFQRHCSEDDGSAENPDFSFLAYGTTLNRLNLDRLRVIAVQRGAPEDDNDVWVVNPDWIKVNPYQSQIPDPFLVTQSQRYQMHLNQLMYAINTVTQESGYPVKKEAIKVSKIPFTSFKDGGKMKFHGRS